MRLRQRALTALCLALLLAVRSDIGAAPAGSAGPSAFAFGYGETRRSSQSERWRFEPAEQAAQQPAIPENASVDELLKIADQLLGESKGNAAFPIYERALAAAIERGLETQQAKAHHGMARVLSFRAQYATARDHGLRAAEVYERLSSTTELARIFVFLSGVEELSGQYADARAHAERAVVLYKTVDDPKGRAYATGQFIRVANLKLEDERPLYASALADARTAGDIPHEASLLHGLGDHLFAENRFEESLDTLLQAESLLLGTTDVGELGTVYNSIGRVYRAHGRLDEALAFQRKALALHEKGGSAFELIQSLNAVAVMYERTADLKNAESHYQRALGMAEKSSSQRIQDFIRANYAAVLLHHGQFARAAGELEQVLAHGLDVYPARRQSSLSFAYSKMDRPSDALDMATNAVNGCQRDEGGCVDSLGRRAAAYAALGNATAALADINSALFRLETLRTRLVPSDFFKQDFNLAQQYIYSQAIALQVAQKQERQALETAELARARAFLDLLTSREVQIKDRDRRVIASLQSDDTSEPSRIELNASNQPGATELTFRGDRTTATARPTGRDLELRSLVTASPFAAADLVATAARLNSTMVVYWVGEDELFIWTVSPAGAITARRVPVLRSRLLELIRETAPFAEKTGTQAIVTRGEATIPVRAMKPAAWHALYDLLIQPISSALPKTRGALLTIVPQGPLLNVSFAALQNARGRYLLEDYSLHYAPAGAVLQFTAHKKRVDARTGPMLLVADPAPSKLSNLDRALPRLPGARGEISQIARLVPASQLTMLQDGLATETRTREAVAGKAVLHFATHAIVRDDDPFGSFLALGPSSGGADGLLTSQEVYGLDLNADLVVLSACRSAGGRVTGDGISAFARAFIYAGTASLVASVWDVADEPTNRLLPDFYKRWLGGASKSRALRDAQLALLRDLRAGRVRIDTPAGQVSIPEHPVFWAGFALFGEPE
jgi:CHAT domain-containing protein/tetratricopeptide (TPR) repeat protein